MKFIDLLKKTSKLLSEAAIPDAHLDSETIILHGAGLDRIEAYRDDPAIDDETVSDICRLINRRISGEPLQYIVGYVNFLDLRIRIGKGVLIPRPETELLALQAIHLIRDRRPDGENIEMLDLCTGSGCIAIALGKAFPKSKVYATDISEEALTFARTNAVENNVPNVSFLQSSLFENIPVEAFDFIVSNPPYVVRSDIPTLQREVRDWEPLNALDGGEDGLDFYRRILPVAARRLRKGGSLLLEIGFGQSNEIRDLALKAGFESERVVKDYAGIERIIISSV